MLRQFRAFFSAFCTVAIVIAATATFVSAQTAADLTTSVTRMAKVGRAGSPTFSPDGKRLAFVSDLTGMPQIWVVPIEGGWPTLVTADNDPVGGVIWSPTSDWLAYSLAPGGGMNTQIYVVKPDGSGQKRLTRGGKETNRLFDWTERGRLAMGTNTRNPSAIDAYLTDPVTAATDLVVQNDALATLEDVSRDEQYGLLSRLIGRGDNNLYLVNLRAQQETLLTPHTGPGTFSGELSPDGRTVYLVSNKDRDLLAFSRIRIDADGSAGPIEVLAERPDAEADGFTLNEQGTLAALVWNVAGRSELSFIDLPAGTVTKGPELPAEIVGGLRFSRDGRMLALTISGAAAPPDIWMMDVQSRKLRQVTRVPHAGVDLTQLVRPELVRFKAHDGLELTGWLYRPQGQTGPGAYVISFHGGPEGQDRPSFRSDYQALLLAGIGVFAPNVRGSSGFGKTFVNLDNGALRVNGIKDIKACADYLVNARIADPGRLGITGGSYGGYMTLAGVTEFPDLFAAGVNLFGMVNFFTFFEHTEPWMAAISTTEYGDPKTQADLLRSLSPLGKLDLIKTPLMVQHGANDTNVPVVEAEQVVNSLKKRGVPVEYILFPDEGHGWRKIPNRVRSTVSMVQFFSKHLRAAPVS
jgi:dipeptidyl aminopeptidase/acylaminoacyl peptidase